MAEPDQYTLGELIRGLEGLRKDMADLIAEMKADRAENARIYVRADVYLERSKVQDQNVADLHRDIGAIDRKIDAEAVKRQAVVDAARADADKKFAVIEADRKADVAWRRTMLLGVTSLAVTVLIAIAGFVITLTR